MLNPTFSKISQFSIVDDYVAPLDISRSTKQGNFDMETGKEYRLQKIFGDEIWLKLERAGLTPEILNGKDVLEVCAGTGFLTYHLLQRCKPKRLTVNDISTTELNAAQKLISSTHPSAKVEWMLGDMHTLEIDKRFDVIIGNSFIHHFHNVPHLLSRISSMLNPGGIFISLHEPTPMSQVVEGGKVFIWPLTIIAPKLIIDIARYRYKGMPSSTDIWMFEAKKIKITAKKCGFSKVTTIPWGIMRPIIVQKMKLSLNIDKPKLSNKEEKIFTKAIKIDTVLNKYLPQSCFGSLSLVCRC
jgi:ubiquinone/menaquinone biosynthesis C-methylase UbiE